MKSDPVKFMSQMLAPTHVRQLADLNRRISEYESLRRGVHRKYATAQRRAANAAMLSAYRGLQKKLRGPAASFNLWPLGVMLLGPLIFASPPFLIAHVQTGEFGTAFGIAGIVAAVASAWFASALFVPGDGQLEQSRREAKRRAIDTKQSADVLKAELSRLDQSLRKDRQARDGILKSVQYKRELLLQENWRAMRGPEWESFLARVFQLLGGVVVSRGATGDQGVDLIVTFDTRHYAFQVKGYFNSVGNGAVQEAVAGMAHCQCNRCGVITNSRFTSGAKALAASNRCLLIGEDEIADLVMGRMAL